MEGIKIALVCCLLAVSVSGQAAQANKKQNTRGNFGQLGGGFGGGGFGGQQGGYQQGGFGQGQGGFGQGGFGQGQGGFGQGQGGFGQGQGGFGQGQGGFGQGGFGQGGGGLVQGGFGGGQQAGGSSRCRYWCKTPEGQAYCCENTNQAPKHPVTAVVNKPGQCPPVRAVCPLRSNFGPPQTCSKHGDCFNADRCCFDRCLGEHVCKAPQYG